MDRDALQSAISEYNKTHRAAWAEYNKTVVAAEAEYNKTVGAARTEYDRIRSTAWAEYDRIRSAAWDRISAGLDSPLVTWIIQNCSSHRVEAIKVLRSLPCSL